ncbi:hypothetical protein [Bradyrhizobium sp.]
MGIDFRDILGLNRLKIWWQRIRLEAARHQLEQISRIVNKKERDDATTPTGDNAGDLERIKKWQTEDKRNLFMLVGEALSLWAQMEDSLVVIAGALLRTKFEKAGVVLYSITNFHVWLGLIDELFALESRYDTVKPKWNKVAERLKKLNDTRARLAHHTIYAVPPLELEGASLRPGRLDLRRRSLKYEPLNTDQMLTFIHSVSRALEDLAAVTNAMTEIILQEPSPEKSDEQDSGQDHP